MRAARSKIIVAIILASLVAAVLGYLWFQRDYRWFALARCLPSDVTLDTKFRREHGGAETTVRQALHDLDAHARGGKIFDGSGREIYFYWVHSSLIRAHYGPNQGAWDQALARELQHVEVLKKTYTVVVMYYLKGVI